MAATMKGREVHERVHRERISADALAGALESFKQTVDVVRNDRLLL